MLVAAAPGLRALIVYSDGTWLVRMAGKPPAPLARKVPGWADIAAGEVLRTMQIAPG